jgi:hypothetical protein
LEEAMDLSRDRNEMNDEFPCGKATGAWSWPPTSN